MFYRYSDSDVEWKPDSESDAASSSEVEGSASASRNISECAISPGISMLSTCLPDEHSSNVSSTTDCVTIYNVRIDSSNGKKWGKKHACKFCSKLVIKMSDHLARCNSRG